MTGILQALLMGYGAVSAAVSDAYFNLVTLLLPGNGTNGAQNNTFLDSSTNNFTITRNGNTTQGTFSPFSQTGWGNFFNGSSDYLNAPAGASFAFSTGAWTIEAWVYVTTLQEILLFDTRSGASTAGVGARIASDGTLSYSGSANNALTTSAITANTWNHVAWVYDGTTLSGYINGVRGGTATPSFNITQNNGVIGRVGFAASGYMAGYISNLRVVKGSAVYSGASFTVPTSPLTAVTNTVLLTCQSNRFVDNSASPLTITVNSAPSVQAFSPFLPTAAYSAATVGGSGYFDGTGDYLSIPDNAAFAFGSGNFTIECWAYMTGTGQQFFISQWSSPQRSWAFLVKNSGTTLSFVYSTTGSNEILVDGTIAAQVNTWAHFAVVRNGNTLTTYMNGVQIASASVTGVTLFDASQAIEIARNPEAPSNWNLTGYAADVRVVKGTAVYTAAFTPPTAPLTAITNTSLLTNFTNAGITDATAKNDLETVGNAQISTTQSKFGGASMSFVRSTSSYLVANNATGLFSFGTGDFTIEAWVYMNSLPSGNGYPDSYWIVGGGPATSNPGFDIAIGSTNLQVGLTSFASLNISVAHGMSATTWYHVAVVRSGATLYAFRDGVQLATASVSGVTADPCLTGLAISAAEPTGATLGNFNGFIDDLRITKGYARYTANFTAPTAAFPLQ